MENNPTGDQYPPNGTFAASSPVVSETEVQVDREKFWKYLDDNLEEVKKWPGWMRGEVVREPCVAAASVLTEGQPQNAPDPNVNRGPSYDQLKSALVQMQQAAMDLAQENKRLAEASHPQDERGAAYKEFWASLSRAGDPARIPNKVKCGFDAGWNAALASRIRK